MSVFITGDTHGDLRRFSNGWGWFPQQSELTKEDIVIVLGDFGCVWKDDDKERHKLDWLNAKRFTTVFIDGNHENFDRLYSDEFPVVDFHGGKAHKIRDSVYHLMRGYVFDFDGKKFFAFGGARSQDIEDGVLSQYDPHFKEKYEELYAMNARFRVNHVSWWAQEMPSAEEMARGKESLKAVGNKVDFVLTHTLPNDVLAGMYHGHYQRDNLSDYLQSLKDDGLVFDQWYCGHYHRDDLSSFYGCRVLYTSIIQVA